VVTISAEMYRKFAFVFERLGSGVVVGPRFVSGHSRDAPISDSDISTYDARSMELDFAMCGSGDVRGTAIPAGDDTEHVSACSTTDAMAAPAYTMTARVLHWLTALERKRHQERAARVKDVLNMAGLPLMPSHTHIVPILVGDPQKCKAASDLLSQHGIYIPPINYPTVPRGSERLRITPTPHHDDGLVDALSEALINVWQRLGLPLKHQALAV
jgi:Aminotransferase class I and II